MTVSKSLAVNESTGICSGQVSFTNLNTSDYGKYIIYIYQHVNDATKILCGSNETTISSNSAFISFNCILPILGEIKVISVWYAKGDAIPTKIGNDTQNLKSLLDGALLIKPTTEYTTKAQGLHLLYDLDISGLKYNIQETITPTLGNQYPYIRRNGNQNYRTFTISSLISFEQEYQRMLLNSSTLKSAYNAITDQRLKERWFREQVLQFLHDGYAKFFSTVEEGSMMVHLTNISLTPKKELGRMIYSFSATATESSAIPDGLLLNTQGPV